MEKPTQEHQEAAAAHYGWIYLWEMESPAYRALNVVERALLMHLRALYRPAAGKVVSLSTQEAVEKVGVSQGRVQQAFRALDARGWIKELEAASDCARTFLLIGRAPEE
ncbi:hypothetical protein JY409_09330 [Stenotrophomonas maltophilia]|nr:hypothetical protein [Stenotrophomonas maltophilia]